LREIVHLKWDTNQMKSKVYPKTLVKWNFRKIPAQKSVNLDNYRLAVRDLEAGYTRSGGVPEYILSNPASKSGISPEQFKEFVMFLKVQEIAKVPIRIEFIKKFGKKFINKIS